MRSGDEASLYITKYNESVEVGEKLASVCSKSSGTAYKRHK